ncbi:MAG: hypothetical protein MRY64_11565 [Hyphomonadaceae bacterium]|nr:hypothetical protein [Hyphomonadaceae bacterium]
MKQIMVTMALCGAVALAACAVSDLRDAPGEPVFENDHARMMHLLGIEQLRPGRNGMDPTHPNYANYDEATSNPYPDLPPLLELEDGTPVTSAQMWRAERRPELIELFDREIYGRVPADVPGVRWEVVAEREGWAGDVPVVIQDLVGHVDNSTWPFISVDIEMTLTRPAAAPGPVPAVLSFVFRPPPGWEPPEGWSPPPGPTPTELVLARGWAHAELVPTSVQADNGAGLREGIVGLANKGEPRAPEDWGALRAWAWGASRVLDHFEEMETVDASRVGVEGLSRYGKAVLVTMAYEPRFAMGFSGSSGEGGASLYRRDNGEILENIAGSGEYHWMAGNFIKYAADPLGWDDLPIDAHSLIALSAPRPLFVGTGLAEEGDGWVDPRGIFMATAEASTVYELLGAKGLPIEDMPEPGTGLTAGELAFRQHLGGHTNGPNWPVFLDFAERYFEAGQGD